MSKIKKEEIIVKLISLIWTLYYELEDGVSCKESMKYYENRIIEIEMAIKKNNLINRKYIERR